MDTIILYHVFDLWNALNNIYYKQYITYFEAININLHTNDVPPGPGPRHRAVPLGVGQGVLGAGVLAPAAQHPPHRAHTHRPVYLHTGLDTDTYLDI